MTAHSNIALGNIGSDNGLVPSDNNVSDSVGTAGRLDWTLEFLKLYGSSKLRSLCWMVLQHQQPSWCMHFENYIIGTIRVNILCYYYMYIKSLVFPVLSLYIHIYTCMYCFVPVVWLPLFCLKTPVHCMKTFKQYHYWPQVTSQFEKYYNIILKIVLSKSAHLILSLYGENFLDQFFLCCMYPVFTCCTCGKILYK